MKSLIAASSLIVLFFVILALLGNVLQAVPVLVEWFR